MSKHIETTCHIEAGCYPETVTVDRDFLFNVFQVLMTVNIENRDDLWNTTTEEIRLLLQSV